MKNIYDIHNFVSVKTEQSIQKDLVNRFVKRRKELRITQKELSAKSRVSYGSIRRFESVGEISLHALLRISSAIGYLDDFESLFQNPTIKDIRK